MDISIPFRGHENIRALHTRTIEITTGAELTPAGDCVVGVGAKTGCAGIPDGAKRLIRDGGRLDMEIRTAGHAFGFSAYGHPDLELSHGSDIVVRRSSFTCPRTLAIRADRASDSLPRSMVAELRAGAPGMLLVRIR